MGTYQILSKEFLNDPIDIHIVEDLSGGGSMATIVYETPGSNGGIIISTGRTNETLAINGKILSKLKYPTPIDIVTDDINNKASQLQDVKDAGTSVIIRGALPTNKTGEYLITDFNWTKPAGQRKYITFNMKLQELRQVNIRQNQLNILGADRVRRMKQLKEVLVSAVS